jgi:DNA polymerase III epsilon subunit-like protein
VAWRKATDPRRSPGWESERFAVIDVETTGLDPREDRVVEIAVVEVDGAGRSLAEYSSLVRIEGCVGASAIHGLDAVALRAAPRFEELADELEMRLRARVAVGHRVAFDLAFLEAELQRAGRPLGNVARVCTIELADALGVAEGSHRLARACAAQGITVAGAHRALSDARATGLLLGRYLRLAESAGYQALDELLDVIASRASGLPDAGVAGPGSRGLSVRPMR